MSKAEEKAMEKYPFMSDDDKEGLDALKYIGMECECASVFNEAQKAKQSYFIEGYRQAEKELIDKAIGWIKEINTHHHIMRYSDSCEPPLSELIEWFKNYMKEENINSK
jgi:hypothetical protein